MNDHAGLATIDWESKCFSAKTPQTRSQASLKCKSFAVPLKSREFRLGRDWKERLRSLGSVTALHSETSPGGFSPKLHFCRPGFPAVGRRLFWSSFCHQTDGFSPVLARCQLACCCPGHPKARCLHRAASPCTCVCVCSARRALRDRKLCFPSKKSHWGLASQNSTGGH